jgi:hypothetical protein
MGPARHGDQLTTARFRFNEVANAPETPGVYSWYYRIELADRDIATCVAEVNSTAATAEREELVKSFLDRRLFRYYKEEPYEVHMGGALKPSYSGLVNHRSDISPSLIRRIAENPERLNEIKSTLRLAVPLFASPIYIGVAKRLRDRLMQHVKLIEYFQQIRASAAGSGLEPTPDSEEEVNDHRFAHEVSMLRDFTTSNLVVNTLELQVEEAIRYDLENILNRINYPLCGRK